MNPFPTKRASELSEQGAQTQWLIENLWTEQAVGILGGEPKCCKSFLALDIALSVASGRDCLRHFPVLRSGQVLLFPAEDSLPIVRRRLEGIAAAAQVDLSALALEVITAPTLRLDSPEHRERLTNTIESIRPILLVLDPLIRLHRIDENDATQIATLLSFLRQLQRQFQLAVLLVHHARKDSGGTRPGQALRGSSELHGWGDSNLYMRRRRQQLTLTTEHRAAPSLDPIPVALNQSECALALEIQKETNPSPEQTPSQSASERIRQALGQIGQPASVQQIRQHCGIRTTSVCQALQELQRNGEVTRSENGYQMTPVSVSHPIAP